MGQQSKTINTILIANRGEIAMRVLVTCRELGIKTVTVYTEKERKLPHAYSGDICLSLGEGPLSETYLNGKKIIELAKQAGAQAIHPGYGLLSENAKFAGMVEEAGLIFIGPTVEAIRLMGDKKMSKQKMEALGIPLVPGYHGNEQDPTFLANQAKQIGYPVMIKASAGGGGKGMRIVERPEDFVSSLEGAKREAKNAFGNDDVLLEKFVQNPRHIEVQVFSDEHKGHFHLFERECSIQRRHQKIVEESPSSALDPETRAAICQTAVDIAAGINYRGAGTIEFIFDDGRAQNAKPKYYFLEMNTRLQVEHPITELVMGKDLVHWQIEVARGHKLPWQQSELKQRGHALEVRLYAEDPDKGFLPVTGTLSYLGGTHLKGVRFDCGYKPGNAVTVDFDPMLAKLVVYAEDRPKAIYKMIKALEDYPMLGLKTNRDYLIRVLAHPAFMEGKTYTHFVQVHKSDLEQPVLTKTQKAQALAAYLLLQQNKSASAGEQTTLATASVSPWDQISGFRNA